MSEREASHWGWGHADQFPKREARKALGDQVGNLLGLPVSGPHDPVPLAEVRVGEPRVDAPAALPFVNAEREDRVRHTYGRAYPDVVRGFGGDFTAAPDLVAHPSTETEVDQVLDWAQGAQVAVVPYGGGTSVVRGVECPLPDGFRGTLSLDLRGLDRVLEVEPSSLTARIQAGATGPRLEAQLAEHGLTLRCFPQSFEFSTLGGWLATRAGGHFATGYTHVDDLTASIRALTPRGPWESRRLPGSGAGPSPDRLMLGSEGALGVITEAWMRVRPRPRYRASASLRFAEFRDAVAACRALAQSGLFPSNCRVLDPREAKLNMVAVDGSSVLLLGFESADHPLHAWMDRALELARDHGGTVAGAVKHAEAGEKTGESGQAGTWKNAFVQMPYLLNVLVSLGVIADTFETACPWDRFDDLHAALVKNVRGAMKAVAGSPCHLSCRFTHVYPDGPAPYYTFIAKARPGAEVEQWAAIKQAASETLMAHGATITHHHAVGRTHRPWYREQRPAPMGDALRALKGALDPAGILNPGVLL
ncbi:MAG: FAD-binding oxidoreductase [Sandaracinus sp.]|nr:FAD-binding oxidoreductase [Sandaracinus sp.]|tara:strand:- start:936 stop:2537 length:1602 start_codon:yes stop_codon:yes gene_type:complete